MAGTTLGAYNIADLRELAKKRLPRGLFEFMDRGCEDEVSLRDRKSTRLNSSHTDISRMPSSA